MLEINEEIKKSKGVFAVPLTDLSREFDCIPTTLLTTQLSTYDFDEKCNFYFSLFE